MPTNRERVLVYLADHPEGQDDDQIGAALHIDRQQINMICRGLADTGSIRRGKPVSGGKIVNWVISSQQSVAASTSVDPVDPPAAPASRGAQTTFTGPLVWLADSHALRLFAYAGATNLGEDQVKAALKQAFEAAGWQTQVRWGHDQGIDIVATHGDERFVLEAKGEGLSDQMRGNYFDGALGELVRRMTAPGTHYGLALPAHRRFIGLVERLPPWGRQRLNLWFFLVRPGEHGLEVGVFPPDARITSLAGSSRELR